MLRINEGLRAYTNSTECLKNGVSINPAIPAIGDKAKIEYTGLFVQEGATHFYVRLDTETNGIILMIIR